MRKIQWRFTSGKSVKKIEIDPKNPRFLKVVWGIGYKMEK